MASIPPPPTEPRMEPPVPDGGPPEAPRPPRWPGWAPWTAPAALITGLLGALFGAVLIAVIAGVSTSEASGDTTSSGVLIASTIVQDAALVLSAMLFAMQWRMPRPGHFGLRRPLVRRAVMTLLAGWAIYFLFGAIWSAIVGGGPKDNLPQELGADRSTAALYVVMALTCVIAPIAEELFFRGYFFPAVSNWRGWRVGAVITGVVFGLIHTGSAPAIYLVPLGFFGFELCVIYRRTGSLYPCIALHALNNALAFGVLEGWGWQIPVLMLVANALIGAIVWPFARSSSPVAA